MPVRAENRKMPPVRPPVRPPRAGSGSILSRFGDLVVCRLQPRHISREKITSRIADRDGRPAEFVWFAALHDVGVDQLFRELRRDNMLAAKNIPGRRCVISRAKRQKRIPRRVPAGAAIPRQPRVGACVEDREQVDSHPDHWPPMSALCRTDPVTARPISKLVSPPACRQAKLKTNDPRCDLGSFPPISGQRSPRKPGEWEWLSRRLGYDCGRPRDFTRCLSAILPALPTPSPGGSSRNTLPHSGHKQKCADSVSARRSVR